MKNKLNILFVVFMIIGLIFVAKGASIYGIDGLVLSLSGYFSCCLSALGYALNKE